MSEEEALSLRERLRAMEVQVTYLRRDFDDMRGDIKSLVSSVGGLTDIMQQARGARWVILAGMTALGAFSTYIPTLFKLLLTVK